jgi:hypothetical protein
MEPVTLTTVATAITIIFFTKVIEKPGENLGQLLWDKTQNLVGRLKGKSDKIAGLLEGTQQQPLNYGEAVLELKALADKDPELAQAMKEVETQASKESNPQLQQKLQEVREEVDKLKDKEPIIQIQNLSQLAEKIGVVNQGVMNNTTFNL